MGFIDPFATVPIDDEAPGTDTVYSSQKVEELVAGGGASLVAAARAPEQMVVGDITRDDNGTALSAAVIWPDGISGAYTTDVVSTAFPGAVDAYHVTHGTATYTQPAVTRDDNGAVSHLPPIVVT